MVAWTTARLSDRHGGAAWSAPRIGRAHSRAPRRLRGASQRTRASAPRGAGRGMTGRRWRTRDTRRLALRHRVARRTRRGRRRREALRAGVADRYLRRDVVPQNADRRQTSPVRARDRARRWETGSCRPPRCAARERPALASRARLPIMTAIATSTRAGDADLEVRARGVRRIPDWLRSQSGIVRHANVICSPSRCSRRALAIIVVWRAVRSCWSMTTRVS